MSPASRRDETILAVVASLGPGQVVSYGDVAADAGWPGRARLVGRLLASCHDELAWWRVVSASGRLVPGLEEQQARLLQDEGVSVAAGRVHRSPAGRFRRPPSL